MKKFVTIGLASIVFVSLFGVASAQIPAVCIPGPSYDAELCYTVTTNPNAPQNQINSSRIFTILQNIAGFLITAAGVVAGIVIIVAGLIWVSAGSNQTRVTNAKAVFKNGVIGALIIFAVGLIINTVIAIATNWSTFFN